jgi:hypothetical protein
MCEIVYIVSVSTEQPIEVDQEKLLKKKKKKTLL